MAVRPPAFREYAESRLPYVRCRTHGTVASDISPHAGNVRQRTDRAADTP